MKTRFMCFLLTENHYALIELNLTIINSIGRKYDDINSLLSYEPNSQRFSKNINSEKRTNPRRPAA